MTVKLTLYPHLQGLSQPSTRSDLSSFAALLPLVRAEIGPPFGSDTGAQGLCKGCRMVWTSSVFA